MKYIIDNDLHIHTYLSKCSNDLNQNKEAILSYAHKYNLKVVCITDHMWDGPIYPFNPFYEGQNFNHIKENLPLLKDDKVTMLFGCEADMDKYFNIGLNKEIIDKLDFIAMSLTHFHIKGSIDENLSLKDKASVWVKRIEYFLNQDLPFYKFGLVHLTTDLIDTNSFENHIEIINLIDDYTFKNLFTKAAKLKVGIELNIKVENYKENELNMILRPYKIAKKCGCKFYFGSDVHHPKDFDKAYLRFCKLVDLLDLEEKDKFELIKKYIK